MDDSAKLPMAIWECDKATTASEPSQVERRLTKEGENGHHQWRSAHNAHHKPYEGGCCKKFIGPAIFIVLILVHMFSLKKLVMLLKIKEDMSP